MVIRLLGAATLGLVAALVATLAERKNKARRQPAHRSYDYPRQLNRADFDRPEAPWLVVVFSSAVCEGCAPIVAKARVLESRVVAVSDCEYQTNRSLHDRYAIEGVPTTVIADAAGIVRCGFIGSVSATDLWAAVADLRNPPAEPRTCASHEPGTVEVPRDEMLA